jgi:hypothetical protein
MVYFQTKNPYLGNFRRAMEEEVGLLYDHLFHFTAIWYIFMTIWNILWPLGIFFTVLVCYTKKNLANPSRIDKINIIYMYTYCPSGVV